MQAFVVGILEVTATSEGARTFEQEYLDHIVSGQRDRFFNVEMEVECVSPRFKIRGKVKDPSGNTLEVDGIYDFAFAHGIDAKSVRQLLDDPDAFISGWSHVDYRPKESDMMRFKNPLGELCETHVRSLARFAKEHGVAYEGLRRVWEKSGAFYRGWTRFDANLHRRTISLDGTIYVILVGPDDKLVWAPKEYRDIKKNEKDAKRKRLDQINEIKNQKEFELKSPDGQIIKGRGIARFAREHGLCSATLHCILKDPRRRHKGWSNVAFKPRESYRLLDPKGDLFVVENDGRGSLKEFCQAHRICPRTIAQVWCGLCQTYKGWTRFDADLHRRVKDPQGNIHVIPPKGLLRFAKEHGLTSAFGNMLRGRTKTSFGWTRVLEEV